MARHAGGIQVDGSLAIGGQGAAVPLAPLQGMVHVAENHQRYRPLATDPFNRQGQVLIAPVTGLLLPVAATGIGGFTAQAGWTAMGQQHQGQGWIGRQGGCGYALGGVMQAEGAKGGEHRLGEMKAATGTGRPGTHHRQPGGAQFPQLPAAVQLRQGVDLHPEGATTGIFAGVVVAEDAGHRHR